MKAKNNQLQIALILLLTLFTLVTLGTVSRVTAQDLTCRPTVSVRFSPKGGATDQVVKEITAANSQILLQAYNFSSAPIAKALTDAAKRQVKVTAVLDRSNESAKYSAATFLKNAGVPTFIDDRHAIAHNKILGSAIQVMLLFS
jgi:phosphatidylserine/phosphatidylglycerophosphate/cardiolipin synthase-like enzyme